MRSTRHARTRTLLLVALVGLVGLTAASGVVSAADDDTINVNRTFEWDPQPDDYDAVATLTVPEDEVVEGAVVDIGEIEQWFNGDIKDKDGFESLGDGKYEMVDEGQTSTLRYRYDLSGLNSDNVDKTWHKESWASFDPNNYYTVEHDGETYNYDYHSTVKGDGVVFEDDHQIKENVVVLGNVTAARRTAGHEIPHLSPETVKVGTVNRTFELDPQPDDYDVLVTLTVPEDKVVEGAVMDLSVLNDRYNYSTITTENIEKIEDDTFEMHDTGEDVVLKYRQGISNINNSEGMSRLHDDWAVFEPFNTYYAQRGSEAPIYEYRYDSSVIGPGAVSNDAPSAGWNFVVLGNVSVVERTVDGATIEVAHPDAATDEHKGDIVRMLAYLNQQHDAGHRGDVLAVADEGDPANPQGNDDFLNVEASDNPFRWLTYWAHEYAHTTDPMINASLNDDEVSTELDGMHEGFADYYQELYPLRMGLGDFGDFEDDWAKGNDYNNETIECKGTNYTNQTLASYTDDCDSIRYHKGSNVIHATDYEIRQATDGEKTYMDVVDRMDANISSGDTITLDDYIEIIETVIVAGGGTNDDADQIASQTETWITTTEGPELWSESEHNDTFGYSDVDTTTTVYRVANGTRTKVNLSANPEIYPNQQIEVEYTSTNQGTATGVADSVKFTVWENTVDTVVKKSSRPFVEPGTSVKIYNYTIPQDTKVDVKTSDTIAELDVQTPEPIDGDTPTDPDGDGIYEDTDGDGDVTHADTTLLVESLDSSAVQNHTAAYDVTGDGEVTYDDVDTIYMTDVEDRTPAPVDGATPADLDGDGQYMDLNDNGEIDFPDVSALNSNLDDPVIQNYVMAYDYNGDGVVDDEDVDILLDKV